MILATYNSFQIPLEVAFDPETLQHENFKKLTVFIDCMFFIDILVSFRTTFINEFNGQEIDSSKLMALHYLKGQFIVDFLATVPFDAIASLILGEAGLFKILGILKLVRVLRLQRMITYLRTNPQNKSVLILFKLVFFLVMYVHCFGCLWWLLVVPSKTWIPPYQWGNPDAWFDIYDQSVTYRYLGSVHTSMMCLTGNCIGPRNSIQIIIASIGLFTGAVINANMFGELAVQVTNLSIKANEF